MSPDAATAARVNYGCGPMAARPASSACTSSRISRTTTSRSRPRELHRVLAPGGVLRLGVPDLDRAYAAYQRGDHAWFHVPDEHAESAGAQLITQIVWYGSVRTPFTFQFAAEQLRRAGFGAVRRCTYRASGVPDLAALDNRERETLLVEAQR